MADIRNHVLSPIFSSPPWKQHVREYIHLLYILNSSGLLDEKSFSWLPGVLQITGMEFSPAEYPLVLESCHQPSFKPFARRIWEWILTRRDNHFSAADFLFDGQDHPLILDWVAQEKNEDLLSLLARIPPPSGMSSGERESAAAIWEKKLQYKGGSWCSATKLSIWNQLYLLTDGREKKLQILQNCLPLLNMESIPLWSRRILDHCHQHPDDEVRFRVHCSNFIRHGQTLYQQWGGWFGISMIGAGEFEPTLLKLVQTHYRVQNRFHEAIWPALSLWRPDDPAIRAELLEWWYEWDVTVSHPVFSPRWRALFTLEHDESRLVQALVETAQKGCFPATPDGWLPRCPQLQSRLADVLTDVLEQTTPDGQQNPSLFHQYHLWPLLFRLPVSGSRMVGFIQSALDSALTDAVARHTVLTGDDRSQLSLSYINQSLRSSGLPADTPMQDIRLTVDMATDRLRHYLCRLDITHLLKMPYWTIMELVREYARRGETPLSGDGISAEVLSLPVAVDSAWVDSTLERMTSGKPVGFNEVVNHIRTVWHKTAPPGSKSIADRLWVTGINKLEEELAFPDTKNCSSLDLKLCLSSLIYLAGQIYPPSPATGLNTGDGKTLAVVPPTPPRLWEMLSHLVQHTQDASVLLMAGTLGNYLAQHGTAGQRAAWWTALGHCSLSIPDVSPDLPQLFRRNFLFNHIAFLLTNIASDAPLERLVDSATAIRSLRTAFHWFPDVPSPVPATWPDVWEAARNQWESEHDGMTMKTGRETGMGTPAFAERTASGLSLRHAISESTSESTVTTGSPVSSSNLCR